MASGDRTQRHRDQRAALLAEERQAFERWQAVVADLDGDTERPDGWTLKDTLAHFAAWHQLSVSRLEQLERGEDAPAPDAGDFNERARGEWARLSWDEALAAARAARAAFVAKVAAMPLAVLDAQDGLGAFIVRANGPEHYAEHFADFAQSS